MGKDRIIISAANNFVGDNRVAKLALYLQQKGFEVLLLGRYWPGGEIPPNRAGKCIRFKLWFNKSWLFYLNLNIRIFIYLLLHKAKWYISVDLDTLPACRLAGILKRVPVVMDSHEYLPEVPELQHRPEIKKIWIILERIFIKGIYAGITVSPGLINIYKEKYNLEFKLLRNLPLRNVKPLNKNSDGRVIYYQGALNVGRGLENSILSLKYLPGYSLVIVGDGDITSDLKALANNEGLSNRVVFVGKVPFEELHKFIKKASVGLCLLENIGLNYYHSLPNRIFDYPMAGIPVIATNFPDISEIVSKYETGLLLNTLDPEKIAEAVIKACEDPYLRERWSHTLPMASSELNWENEVKIIDPIFCP